MNLGSDPADQVVRYTLEGTEFALRISGTAAKNFAIFAAAVLRDQKKTRGQDQPDPAAAGGQAAEVFLGLCRPDAGICAGGQAPRPAVRADARPHQSRQHRDRYLADDAAKWNGSSTGCNWMWWKLARRKL